jgi:predicted nuclease of predicted toxin-antitoxin system
MSWDRRLLADENIPSACILALREEGFDVEAVSVRMRGATDVQVLTAAREQGRWLLTFDRDYGELIFHRGLAPPPGVLYLRFVPESPDAPARAVLAALAHLHGDGLFVVVASDGSLRSLAFPGHERV